MKITKERAKELRWLGAVWPNQERCKNILPESEEERKRVKEIWDKNPSGFSSYYSTLCDIEQGRVEELQAALKKAGKEVTLQELQEMQRKVIYETDPRLDPNFESSEGET